MDSRGLLNQRVKSYEIKRAAHARTFDSQDRKGRTLGLAVVILTTVVGTSVFTSLNNDPSLAATLTVAILSILAAVAAATKEYMSYDKRSVEHRQAAADFGRLRNDAQEMLASGKITAESVKTLGDAAESLDEREPALPKKAYQEAENWVKEQRPEIWAPEPGDTSPPGGRRP